MGAVLSGERIPPSVIEAIEQLLASKWTGRVTLNIRDGAVLDYEVALKERVIPQRRNPR